ncbi:florfenicol exporter, putative [Talaromyces stipitatus ATCC 10500]|uniref:Florfenicol exporter, putative n=1 Tax=Talaromyces stipitatus (strain ATCC 10500 / CBS 375.48 / QM 6759 / NRRL 1006) TaxID=441959 RepID=B8LVX1_TALSN|nr:florfenicol exporter, putative [Talaromyces stipitatus ATCC 10500]EED24337.1 florfenicol exporter, putative [Talaromyces stipitatus ATCC 10500]
MANTREEQGITSSSDNINAVINDAEKGKSSSIFQSPSFETSGEVTWDGPNNPNDPYNWPTARKITISLIISLSQLVCLMTTSVIAPALPQIATDLNLSDSEAQLAFSIFVLGQAFGPFVIAPMSEVFGRKPVWVVCSIFFILWNSVCPVGNLRPLIIGRFLSGAGGSCGVSLAGPIAVDMFRQKDRGKSLALASLFPYLGPALGPIVGGLVSQYVSWPWLFWAMSIFCAAVLVAGLIFVRETCKPVLLRLKATQQLREAGEGHVTATMVKQSSPDDRLSSRILVGLKRPVQLLLTRPIIQILCLINGIGFGMYILVLSFYATVFIDQYHQSATASSLQYIAIALGSTLSTQTGGHLMDIIFARLLARLPENSPLRDSPPPEFRVPLIVVGILILPIGLFWLGWSAQAHIAWIMVDIGATIFVAGNFLGSQAALAYLFDEFSTHTASAGAAIRLLGNLMGFAFPLFAPQLYDGLGYGWGNSLLAFIWVVTVVPIPFVLWCWGEKLRAIGRK